MHGLRGIIHFISTTTKRVDCRRSEKKKKSQNTQKLKRTLFNQTKQNRMRIVEEILVFKAMYNLRLVPSSFCSKRLGLGLEANQEELTDGFSAWPSSARNPSMHESDQMSPLPIIAAITGSGKSPDIYVFFAQLIHPSLDQRHSTTGALHPSNFSYTVQKKKRTFGLF